MSFAVTETQVMFGETMGRLLDAESEFEARRHRLSGPHPDRMALWPVLAEQGILGAAFSEDVGGFGGTMRDLAVVMSEVGRKLIVEPVLATALCGRILQAAGDDVSWLIEGKGVLSLAHEEGHDPFALPSTTATDSSGVFRICGRKILARHADLAQKLVVTATHNGVLGAYLVDTGAEGVTLEVFRLIDGSSAASVGLNSVEARFLVGGEVVEAVLGQALVALAAETHGIVSALNSATFNYLRTRKQFGVALASFQALQHRIADMHMAAEEIRALANRAIDAMDAGSDDRMALASAVKALADDAGRRVAHEAVQLHGGMGVSDELDVSHYMRRLAAIRAELGGADVHRARFFEADAKFVKETEFRTEVRDFVRSHLPEDITRKGVLGLEIHKEDYVRWQKILREKGWFGAAWPVEHGGSGWSLERQLVFLQEASLNNAPMIMPYGVNMIGPVLQAFGTVEQRAKYLPGILSSDTWWWQGSSEPNAGSDLASLKTTAVREGDQYIVNGTKMWTTEAHWAEMMHCLVRTERGAKPQRGISFLLIDMKSPGIEVRPIITIDGQHHTNQIFFDDVRVPVENRVGAEGEGWAIAKFLLSNERVAIADTGPKLRLLRTIKAMLRGVPQSPARTLLTNKLADAEIQMLALCALEESYVADWTDGRSKEGPNASVLKIRGTEILQLLSEIALEIEGPMGAAHDPSDLHRSPSGDFTPAQRASLLAHQYLYGRCWSIFGGTNEIQRNLIARTLLAS
jgi:alkylation response protein AidB-like acyl-CoA dehydrogenase